LIVDFFSVGIAAGGGGLETENGGDKSGATAMGWTDESLFVVVFVGDCRSGYCVLELSDFDIRGTCE
jgi:hypothetical protein